MNHHLTEQTLKMMEVNIYFTRTVINLITFHHAIRIQWKGHGQIRKKTSKPQFYGTVLTSHLKYTVKSEGRLTHLTFVSTFQDHAKFLSTSCKHKR